MESNEQLLIRIDQKVLGIEMDIKNILAQTTATNGRVTTLEIWRSKIRGFHAAVATIGTVIGVIIGYIISK